MRRIRKTSVAEILTLEELTQIERLLFKNACEVRLNAQAPYSRYRVGCAIVTDSPKVGIVRGCNVENVNWSESVHAEENAISSMISLIGPSKIVAIAVVGAPEDKQVIWPPKTTSVPENLEIQDLCPSCGHCLQVIAEHCYNTDGLFDPKIPLLGYKTKGNCNFFYLTTIGDAYPMPFLPQHLGVNYANNRRLKERSQ